MEILEIIQNLIAKGLDPEDALISASFLFANYSEEVVCNEN